MPSQARSARIPSTYSSRLRAVSVSSILSRNRPPACLASSQLCSAVRMLPTCRCPVGEGAKRVVTVMTRDYVRREPPSNAQLERIAQNRSRFRRGSNGREYPPLKKPSAGEAFSPPEGGLFPLIPQDCGRKATGGRPADWLSPTP